VGDLAAMEIKPVRKDNSDKARSRVGLVLKSNNRQQNYL
jgi:hypothetical protein